jgi:hypothetical protein
MIMYFEFSFDFEGNEDLAKQNKIRKVQDIECQQNPINALNEKNLF